jgi:acyl-[acyl carrier protein]--UDP-N-acetylglucosamine O-acyltransferase
MFRSVPYSIIGKHVEIGDNTVIGPHVVIAGSDAHRL